VGAPKQSRWCALALLLAACGGGPQLTHLRCRETPCQDPEDPFKLRLAVDFSDPSGTLSEGTLELLLDGTLQNAVSLNDLFTAQGIGARATSGTLSVDEEFALDSVSSGESFNVGLTAKNGDGQSSNTPELDLTLELGSP